MTEQPVVTFGELLRRHRTAANKTQGELAEASGLTPHAISDLERGVTVRPHTETVQLLADALNLTGADREQFKAAAVLGRNLVSGPRLTGSGPSAQEAAAVAASARLRGDPRAWLAHTVATLDGLGVAAARSAVAQWQAQGTLDGAWLSWVDGLIELTSEGHLVRGAQRSLPASGTGPFLGREQQTADLDAFLDRVKHGRGGLALVLGPDGIGKSRLIFEVLTGRPGDFQAEWMTFDRGEAGYQGWRRLLAPLWIAVRRSELAPASLIAHTMTLDDVLLVGSDSELAGKHLPGAVAAAVAALTVHLAQSRPLALIVDDAYRGGASSDHLLLDVARRVNAFSVGLVAAVRPDELDEDSPLREYCQQSGERAAADVVTPVHLPPLDLHATASLLTHRTGAEPPPAIVERVLRETGGRPQLINNTQIQAPVGDTPDASWAVGVLESAIYSRSEAVRNILRAAAVGADGGCVEPDVIARVTDQPVNLVEQILDQERQQGSILTPEISRYCFQHDNWIDTLIRTCQPAQRHALHARYLELLRPDPASDPRKLARHAIGAGAAQVGEQEIMTLARNAADLHVADYAFGAAAELYEIAARHASGLEQIDLLIAQSDALRFRGWWKDARHALKQAASLARTLDIAGREAIALMHLERLTWTYGLDENEITHQIRDVIERLPTGDSELRTQARAALALRLSIASRQYENEQADLAMAALRQLPSVTNRLARADIILGIRGGLQDSSSPEELLDYDQKVLAIGIELRSAYHIGEALVARVIDLIRAGRSFDLPSALRAQREFADQSEAPYVVYARALINAMVALARGEFDAARSHTAEAGSLSKAWGESMAQEALLAQGGWLLYETGEIDVLTEILSALPEQDVSSLNEPVWTLGTALMHAEKGEADAAIRILREVCNSTQDFSGLPRGPGRIGILATAAMVLGHPAVCDVIPEEEATRLGGSLAELLTAHSDAFVMAGWPAVVLGSKHRYIGLAHLAAGQAADAATHLARAVEEDSEFAVLQVRAQFDLVRAVLRQSGSRSEGLAAMRRVQRRASELGMPGLAAQAVAACES